MGRPRLHEKCQLTWCPRPHSSHGYCKAHALRFKRNKPLDAPFKERRQRENERKQVLSEVVEICEYWAGIYMSPEVRELAALFRRLE